MMIQLIVAVFPAFFFGSMEAKASEPRTALVDALITVESNGNDRAIGDKHLAQKAYGCLQIRQPVCDDINRRYGTRYRAEQCIGNRVLSRELHRRYMEMYATTERLGREPTLEDKSRIWNGGPAACFDSGAIDRFGNKPKNLKVRAAVARCQQRAKVEYWQKKVKPALEKLEKSK